jgi:glycosyltransferase involved in cell wall biosynthesis
MALVKQHDVADSIDLRPLMPHAEMASLLARCDAGLLAYDRDWGTFGLPNRLFEYMAAGLPIIAPTYAAAMRHVVDAERCGVIVDCEDPQALADALSALRGNPALARELGARAREAFLERHHWEFESEPLIAVMRNLLPAYPLFRRATKEQES